ncbi:MAG: tetratricopeptide repeat protein [Anaerolineae bacterium]|nr:tetratricopeptide repeat protein [Anaerolineae bacterium]
MPKGRRSDYAYSRNAGSAQSFKPLPRRMQEGLEEADVLTQRGNLLAARQVLDDLDRQYPNREEILTDLVNLNIQLNNLPNLIATCERLIKVSPYIPEAHISLAGAYLDSNYPTLALHRFRHFVKQFSSHQRASEIRELVTELEPTVEEMRRDVGLDDAALSEKHEQAQVYLSQGHYAQGRRLCEELIRARPDFVSAYNNLSLLHYADGRYEDAIDVAKRALEINPQNVHALSNLTRFYCLSGRLGEARTTANQLQQLPTTANVDLAIKKAEAFSFVGDDQVVLDGVLAVEQAWPDDKRDQLDNPFLWHLGGVAAMRLGDEKTARRLWGRALSISPGFELAQENLDELSLPIGERHTAWPFSLGYWMRRVILDALIAETSATAHTSIRTDDDDTPHLAKATQRVLRKYPDLQTLVPMLLQRGDPQGRELALMVAQMSKTPAMLNALRDFALGQFGPDAMRMKAGQLAREAKPAAARANPDVAKRRMARVAADGVQNHNPAIRDQPFAPCARSGRASVRCFGG